MLKNIQAIQIFESYFYKNTLIILQSDTHLNLIRINQFFRAILERTPAPGTKYFRLRRRHPIRRKEDLRPRRCHAVGGEEHLRPRRRHPRRRRHDGLEPGLLWFRSYKSMGRGPFFEQPTNLPVFLFRCFSFTPRATCWKEK